MAGWNFSDDFEKHHRWESTVNWAEKYGGKELISALEDGDYYCVDILTRAAHLGYDWGEISPAATKPTKNDLVIFFRIIETHWDRIAGKDSKFTRPIKFSGKKSRSLTIEYNTDALPSWGTWGNDPGGYHKQQFSDRTAFSTLRKNINNSIHPHKIDHIVFQRKKTVST